MITEGLALAGAASALIAGMLYEFREKVPEFKIYARDLIPLFGTGTVMARAEDEMDYRHRSYNIPKTCTGAILMIAYQATLVIGADKLYNAIF